MQGFVAFIVASLIPPIVIDAAEPRPRQARDGMVEAHNAVRQRITPDLPSLSWSERTAEQAQAWADALARDGCEMRHNPDLQEYGQNLYWAGPAREVAITRLTRTGEAVDRDVKISVQEIAAEDVVASWASEKQWYDADTNECQAPKGASCGHYTQIVWADTTAVGCGMSVCESQGQIWVCDYYPAGNIAGQRPY